MKFESFTKFQANALSEETRYRDAAQANSSLNYLVSIFVLFAVLSSSVTIAQSHELIHFDTADGGNIEASFFAASSTLIVIFAHGAIFDIEFINPVRPQ